MFAVIYESLPPDAQRALLQQHLLPLLDAHSQALSSALQAHARFSAMPRLDLKGKKKEVNGLMDALNLDAKLAITRDRSIREELLTEVVDSLTSWLNDIWSVAYEFHDNYHLVHVCLLFTADVASTLSEVPGLGCKCSLINMPIDIRIKARDGSLVKSFVLRGPHTLAKPILWIWRDVFVSILAHGTMFAKNKIPEMIEDIEMLMGWEALERLLYGGRSYDDDDDSEDEEELPHDGIFGYVSEEDNDQKLTYEDSCKFPDEPFPMLAAHWPTSTHQHQNHLRQLIQNHLHTLFRALPTLPMFKSIRAISAKSPNETDKILFQETNDNATKSPDTLAGALAIYTAESNAQRISQLLDTHSHLLRPSDTPVLQHAVRVLMVSGAGGHTYAPRALQILKRELLATVRAIHAALIGVFGLVDYATHKNDLEEILLLRIESPERADRIRRWADAVLTYPVPMNPMAFAAMMMGFPPADAGEEGLGAGGAGDPAGFLDDVDDVDPDWDEMKEEFRPPLRERFDAWYQLAGVWKEVTYKTILVDVYVKVVSVMPYLRGVDVVECMVSRLFEIHGKAHIARALQSLSSFCIAQRRRITVAENKQRRAADWGGLGSTPSLFSSATTRTAATMATRTLPFHSDADADADTDEPLDSLFFGMDDVD